MALLSLQGVTLNLGGKTLLRSADLHIEQGERVCLTGRNGAGKSSLMALLGGDLTPDSGVVLRQPGIRPGYMHQAVPEGWSGPVFGIVADGLGEEGRALTQAHLAEKLLADQQSPDSSVPDNPVPGNLSPDNPVPDNLSPDNPAKASLSQAQRLHIPLQQMHRNALQGRDTAGSDQAWERHGEVLSVIRRLGLNPDAEFATLSGGGKRRAALARALVSTDVLLLDEPTNHLDISTISWLEEFLLRRAGTVLFISHDRAFVRRLATRVVEVDRADLHSYACGYDTFIERRDQRLEAEEQQAALFDKKLAKEEGWIRQGVKARRTRNMGRVRALEALRAERAARREKPGNAILHTQEAERSGKLVLEANNVSFMYPDGYAVLRDFSTVIQRGDRVGLVGDNGVGKTTLLRLLLGELAPTSGSIRLGTKLEISYFDQLRATLDPTLSVMDSVADGNDSVIVDGRQRHVAGYLRDFLFDSDRLRIPVSALSGGERNRLLLARLFTSPSNLLVMDEPTNDLDVETLELLEEMLTAYNGTLLVVSHDRMFLDDIATSTLALEGDGLVHEYVGGYTDWVRQRNSREGAQASRKETPKRSRSETRRLSFKEQREQGLLREELEALPQTMAKLEQEQATLETDMADPEFFSRSPEAFHAAASRMEAIDAEQTALLERWEAIEARLAELDPKPSLPSE